MKIEKITENKIKIILKQEDFKNKSINMRNMFFTTSEYQNLFLEILNIAKKEVDFDTDGHKLLIETFFQEDDIFVFMITKYLDNTNAQKNKPRKYLTVKKKTPCANSSYNICEFNTFDDFCEFCNYINKNNNINIKYLFKTSILYFYNNTYYLVIEGINVNNNFINSFFSSLLEFSSFTTLTKNFKYKLEEHGKIIMKNNAINNGIKYFSK